LGAFSIGRSSKCNLSIADALVSRKHVVLHVAPDAVVVEDLSSRNGVVVNGAVIPGRCRLTHLDRIYVGSAELVLVDAAKITDGIDTAPHIICLACGAVNGPAKRHCGGCRNRLASAAGATFKEPTAVPPSLRESHPGEWEEAEDTRMGETRDVLEGIAAQAINMGRYDEAERMLLPHMDMLLERAVRQQPLSKLKEEDPDEVFRTAIGNALELAQGLREPKWIDWVFRMHLATGRLMDEQTIERLHTLVRNLEYKRRRYVRVYLHGIRNQTPDYGPSERLLANRLDGLVQVILARR
jgi:hypothetical protein